METLLKKATQQHERLTSEHIRLERAYRNEDAAVQKLESLLADIPNQSDWLPPEDLEHKAQTLRADLEQRKRDRYRLELKKIKLETLLSISQNKLNEVRECLELVERIKIPWH